jgi:membrane protein YqaA with SNARE-associated domain
MTHTALFKTASYLEKLQAIMNPDKALISGTAPFDQRVADALMRTLAGVGVGGTVGYALGDKEGAKKGIMAGGLLGLTSRDIEKLVRKAQSKGTQQDANRLITDFKRGLTP